MEPFALFPAPCPAGIRDPPHATQPQRPLPALHPARVTTGDNGVTSFGTSRAGGLIMVGIAAGDEGQRQPMARDPGRRRAAGIYGSIITAAIIAAASGAPTAALAVSVLITLLVYWLAEGYAEVLGEQAAGGKLP